MNPIRVMITDDHLIVREGLRLILETAEGVDIVGEASDGADCLQLVPAVNPHVILMDLQMPRMDGITAIGHLRREHPEIAIVILTTFNEVDMKPVMDLRGRYKEKFKEKYGVGLGFMSFFTKAVCAALKEFPAVNASIDKEEVVYHDYCDISIAVSTPRGLVVPVIRNADRLSFDQIESEVIRLATRGRDGKLSIEEMTGGTFSITNGGVFGSMLSTPIINPPQSAILGMHNIVERPVVKNGEIVVRPVMFLALSYDHRIVDGRESVSFLVRVKEMLEDPGRLILGV